MTNKSPEASLNIGDPVNDLDFEATNGLTAKLSDFRNRWLILYFYPKDATPGCTIEAQGFRDAYPELQALHTTVLGISRDGLKSHERFKCAQELPFELISDEKEVLCNYFNVIKMKSMYGKQVRGIERSTFIIDPQGVLAYEWRKVSVKGHVLDIINTLHGLQK